MLINPDLQSEQDVFKKLKEYGIDQTGWFSTSNIYEAKKKTF